MDAIEKINTEVPVIAVPGGKLKDLSPKKVSKLIDSFCTPDMHYNDLVSVIGKLVSKGVDHDTLSDNALLFEKYISEGSETMAGRTVASVIKDLKVYADQVGSYPLVQPPNAIDVIEKFLYSQGEFKRNVITRQLELNGKPIDDINVNELWRTGARIHSGITKDKIENIINSEFPKEYNPFLDFIEKNKKRKTKGVIDEFIKCVPTDTGVLDNYVKDFFTRWLVGIIESMNGGFCDLMLVVTGPQNSGKTHFFSNLLPAELEQYFAKKDLGAINSDTLKRDLELTTCNKLLILDDEMSGKSRRDEKFIKQLLSTRTVTCRPAYGRRDETRKRIAVFCGTTNDKEVLQDVTGNRRIIPINLEAPVNRKIYNEIDHVDLLMEAYWLWKGGFAWRLSDQDIEKLNANTEEFEPRSGEMELLEKYFEESTGAGLWEWYTLSDIEKYIRERDRDIMVERAGIKRALVKKGWAVSPLKKVKGQVGRYYKLIELVTGLQEVTNDFLDL